MSPHLLLVSLPERAKQPLGFLHELGDPLGTFPSLFSVDLKVVLKLLRRRVGF